MDTPNTAVETFPAPNCPETGLPRVEVVTTRRVYVITATSGTPDQRDCELMPDTSLGYAKEVARFARGKIKLEGVKLTRQYRVAARFDWAPHLCQADVLQAHGQIAEDEADYMPFGGEEYIGRVST